MWFWRGGRTIPWTERVTNEEVPKIVEEKTAAETSCGKTKWDGWPFLATLNLVSLPCLRDCWRNVA